MRAVYLYVIGAPLSFGTKDLPVKIGISIDPVARCRNLQAGSPVPLEIHGTWRISEGSINRACAYETRLHEQFSARHSHGEWFHVSVRDVMYALQSMFYVAGGRGDRNKAFYDCYEGRRPVPFLRNSSVRPQTPDDAVAISDECVSELPELPAKPDRRRRTRPAICRRANSPVDDDIARQRAA